MELPIIIFLFEQSFDHGRFISFQLLVFKVFE
jgi:hypothetical protein